MSDAARRAAPDSLLLAGAERAAALLLAMGKPLATRLLRHFEPRELREVAQAAATLSEVPGAALEAIVAQFSEEFASGAPLLGGPGRARELLSEAGPPDKVSAIMAEAFGSDAPDVWSQLAAAPDKALAAYLAREHALTATYILSRLEAPAAGRVIALLPAPMRDEIFSRMVAPLALSDGALAVIGRALQSDFLDAAARAPTADSNTRVAQILNNLDPAAADSVMQSLARARPQEARKLRSLLFSFNDLPKLSLRARALLFDKIPTDIVVLALRGTDAAFRDVVLGALASRARRLVESELAASSAAPPRDIARARKQIADIVLGMAQRNEIEIARPEETDAAA